MSEHRAIAGKRGQGDCPDWAPLLGLVGARRAGEFMWMFEVALADGSVAHAYKHVLTRRYMYVAEDGRTLALTRSGRYRPIAQGDALAAALGGG